MKYVSILVLEDCINYCECLKEELKECHSDKIKLNIHIATNTSEAKALLKIVDFNFIILDLNISSEIGDSFIDYVNQKTNSKSIILTQDTDTKRREILFEKNIIDYLSKKNHIIHIASDIVKIIENYYDNFFKRILIVDCLVSSRKKLEKVFKNRNYKIVKVDDGNKALKVLQKKEFDLVLIDIDTNIVSTNDVIYAIRSSRSNNYLPIIVFSDKDDYEDISRALKSGANEFIRKPYKLEDIILKSQRVLELYSSQKKLFLLNKELRREVQKAKKETKRRVEQEKLLIQQSRLAAMGEMIGNIAHQWKQPLTALNSTIEDIEFKDRLNKLTPQTIKQNVSTSKELIKYMSKTIDDFQDFFKPNRNKDFFSLEQIIENNLAIISNFVKLNNIKIEKCIQKNTKVLGYKNDLSQAILNILNNAKDILILREIENKHIRITIEDSKLTYSDGKEFITIPSINIIIIDNGGGIEDNIIEKIFDPYFTTKHKSQGTGIGLYMVKQIIENSFNGQILVSNEMLTIDNKTYKGAKFSIKIPIASIAKNASIFS